MTGKVNPNNDEARRIAAELAKKQQAQRVQELEAIDPDQRAKHQQFRALMKADDEDESSQVTSTAPSPFQPSFYTSNAKNSGLEPKLAMPSPSYSPTPNINHMPQDSFNLLPEDPLSDEGLPQSPAYYEASDLPWQSMNSPDFQEDLSVQMQGQTTQPAHPDGTKPRKQTAAVDPKDDGKKDPRLNQKLVETPPKAKPLDANPFGLAGKPTAANSLDAHALAKKQSAKNQDNKKTDNENSQPSSHFWNEEKNQSGSTSVQSNRNEPERKITGTAKTGDIDARTETKKALPKPFDTILQNSKDQPAHEESKSKTRESKKESSDSSGPNQTNIIAPQFQGTADAAAVAPAPYARPELAQLFCQTVSTIIVSKLPSGISKTEFVLNNPRFANSRFAGASIEITRYSTAPDALNIRISGSPEAVSAFNQSKDSLMATFQNGYDSGNFKFQITRIDVDQASSKPVFHRREKGQDQGGSDQEGRDK